MATRRTFLKGIATATLATAASSRRVLGANDRVRVGFIGIGLIGTRHLLDFQAQPDCEVAGISELSDERMDFGVAKAGNNPARFPDFRRMLERSDIDAIVVATPDHWHALLTIMACAAGKDVYVEKPMTVFVDEGKWMVQAARKYNRMVTVGTQRRHGKGVAGAKKVIEGGSLGKVHSVRLASYRNIYPGFGKTKVEDPPPGFDYDMWLGPAPKRPYQEHRGLYHFRWFWDYSGGQMTNLGAHELDVVQWAMQVKGPVAVSSSGGRFALQDNGETPDTQDALFQYPGFTA